VVGACRDFFGRNDGGDFFVFNEDGKVADLIGENNLPGREGFHEIRLQRNGGQGCRRAIALLRRSSLAAAKEPEGCLYFHEVA